jgi:xanthine/CO dehydrogenase XdhC/CoxF family maturation factor
VGRTGAGFAVANGVTLSRPEDVSAQVSITSQSITLLMSHNYSHDLEMLGFLLSSPARYIGVMGPRQRTERMLVDLGASQAAADRLHAPAGLDIGSNSPREIAVSIIAEIRAVLNGRSGGMLRERRGAIHGNPGEPGVRHHRGGAGPSSWRRDGRCWRGGGRRFQLPVELAT